MTQTGGSEGIGNALAAEEVERAFSYAKDVLRQGMPRAAVEEVLRGRGFDAAAAKDIVERADEAKDERRTAGKRHMIMGAILCAVGIVFSVVSYDSAAQGGTYFVMWGAIAVGGIQFFRGLIQMTDK